MPRFRYVHDTFWSGNTGRALRGDHLGQAVAVYLMTCRHANQIGLYYLPIPIMSHEIGSTLQGASKGLRRVCELGFSDYDEASEWVFLPRMAHFQIGDTLSEKDRRWKGVLNQLGEAAASPYVSAFYEIYGDRFALGEYDQFEGACKGLRRGYESAKQKTATPSKQERERKRRERGEKEEREKEGLAVFKAWKETLPNSNQVKFTDKRRSKIAARRSDGYDQADLLAAVQGWQFDSWADRKNQNSLEILLRDGAQVEKFAKLFRNRHEDLPDGWESL